MSAPLHVLLKADPRLEGDVADDKAELFGVHTTSPDICLAVFFFRNGWLHGPPTCA